MIRSPWFTVQDNWRDGVLADATPDDVLTLAMALVGLQQDGALPAEYSPSPAHLPVADPVLPAAMAVPDAPAPPTMTASVATPPEAPVVHATPDQVSLPPNPQSAPGESDLFAQFAGMYADFSGDQALSDLLGSDWALHNGWQGAGGAPLG